MRYWVVASGDVPGVRDPLPPPGHAVVPLQPDEAGHCSVEGGPLARRGGRRRTASGERRCSVPAVVHVAVHTPDGVREGSRLIRGMLPRRPLRVAVAGEDLPRRWALPGRRLAHRRARAAPCSARTGTESSAAGVRPTDDGLRLAFAEAGDVVYERLRRPAPDPVGVTQPGRARRGRRGLPRLKRGIPDDEVLLNDDSTPAAAGEPADVTVLSDEPERIVRRVSRVRGRLPGGRRRDRCETAGAPRWTAAPCASYPATTRSRPSRCRRVEHTVVLELPGPGLAAGALVSAGSGLVLLALLVWPWWTRRRRSVRFGGAPDTLRHPVAARIRPVEPSVL